ncbi:unnamed protein product [Brassica oleracea]
MAANSSSVSVINHMPLSSLRSVSVPLSDRKLPTFRAFSSTAMADAKYAGMDDVQRRLMFEDDYLVGNLVSLATVVYCLVLYTGFSFFGARHQCAGPVDGNWFQILLFKFGIDLLNSLVALPSLLDRVMMRTGVP